MQWECRYVVVLRYGDAISSFVFPRVQSPSGFGTCCIRVIWEQRKKSVASGRYKSRAWESKTHGVWQGFFFKNFSWDRKHIIHNSQVLLVKPFKIAFRQMFYSSKFQSNVRAPICPLLFIPYYCRANLCTRLNFILNFWKKNRFYIDCKFTANYPFAIKVF